jgi:cell division septation protein DedD
VQVGAFKDAEAARRLAARLREQNYPVDESTKTMGDAPAEASRPTPHAPAPGDRYDVLISGAAAADINTKLAAKGLASEPAGEGVRIRPSLPLRDAVALSKDLGTEGFKVQVRRATAAAPPPETPAVSAGAGTGQTLYRVRVGGYPDRASALGVLRELEGKGYQPFIARGRE